MRNIFLVFIALISYSAMAGIEIPRVESGIYVLPETKGCIYQVFQSSDLKKLQVKVTNDPSASGPGGYWYCVVDDVRVGEGVILEFDYYHDQSECGEYACFVNSKKQALWIGNSTTLCLDENCIGRKMSKI